MLIEVFKSGTHRDSRGRTQQYTDESIREIVSKYNSKISQDISFMAPIVKGHPSDDAPAYGWVEYLTKKGKTILAKIKNIDPEFTAELKAGKYKKISVALYPDNMLKHIGFLGAVPPAVKGLKPIDYTEEADELSFEMDYCSYSEIENENDFISSRVKELEEKIKYYEDTLHNIEQENKISACREYCNSFIGKSGKNGIKPLYVKYLTDILLMANSLDAINGIEQNSEIVKEFIEQLADGIDTSEYTVANYDSKTVKNQFEGKAVNESRMQLHNKAIEITKANPQISYNEAVCMAFK